MKTASTVVVIYETPEARESAVSFCDSLVQRFWSQSEFELSWWGYPLLLEPRAAAEALAKAAGSDLLIFAPHKPIVPDHVRSWLEDLLLLRAEREGALVALPVRESRSAELSAGLHAYLRSVAHRAGVDFLTELPQNIVRTMPDSPEFCAERAGQMSQLLDDILRRPAPPPHLP